jgi:osmotically-inducible protein OsmY
MRTDSDIRKDLLAQLQWEPVLHANVINATVKNGIVTLYGKVEGYEKKMAAEKVAKRIAGVKAVVENIRVGNSVINKTDAQIAKEILRELGWHVVIKENKIKIKVEHGIVTLEGIVDWAYQRFAIKREIERIPGVKHVNNYITVKAKPVERSTQISIH